MWCNHGLGSVLSWDPRPHDTFDHDIEAAGGGGRGDDTRHTGWVRTNSVGGSRFEFMTAVAPFHELHSNLTLAFVVASLMVVIVSGLVGSLSPSDCVEMLALWIRFERNDCCKGHT